MHDCVCRRQRHAAFCVSQLVGLLQLGGSVTPHAVIDTPLQPGPGANVH